MENDKVEDETKQKKRKRIYIISSIMKFTSKMHLRPEKDELYHFDNNTMEKTTTKTKKWRTCGGEYFSKQGQFERKCKTNPSSSDELIFAFKEM